MCLLPNSPSSCHALPGQPPLPSSTLLAPGAPFSSTKAVDLLLWKSKKDFRGPFNFISTPLTWKNIKQNPFSSALRFHCFLLSSQVNIFHGPPAKCRGPSARRLRCLTDWPPSPQARETRRRRLGSAAPVLRTACGGRARTRRTWASVRQASPAAARVCSPTPSPPTPA